MLVAMVASLLLAGAGGAEAEDFFSALFGGLAAPQRAFREQPPLPFSAEGDYAPAPRSSAPARSFSGGGQAYCVRTCDGRYFPINAPDNQSRAEACNSFCPASDTKVFYGSSIDTASAGGKSYSELPNAFKYRNEIVAGCTCNGKDQFGLAKVDIKDDPTVRKGDIVAAADGLMVAGRADRRRGELNFSPVSAQVRARYQQFPVVASD
ncbi:MAG TPA: DUF2865 domain-containing protein [Rhodopseudomonas sp.]|uniref:DUF2865 domain-containing protein n=1 Tax=Rhodopseudomonas sp. TaxID=1078 RepID=UPI002EDA30DF